MQPISGATSASPGTSADFDFKDLCGPEDNQQQIHNELAEYVNLNGNGSGRKFE